MNKQPNPKQSDVVSNWFGDRFEELHPKLQELHLFGGSLKGSISLYYGSGIAGTIGRRLAKKMRLPEAGEHELVVSISHTEESLLWDRCFNGEQTVRSVFTPIGNIEQGCWLETTGPLALRLSVDPSNGVWRWLSLSYRLYNIPIPAWLLPKTTAYKQIENGAYRFYVEVSLPLLGILVCYQGLLE